MNKELLELNNHINDQFGFDYSYDEEFFRLIGVETKSKESGSESYSYENYDFVPYDKNGIDSGNEYDDDERNAVVDGDVVNIDKKENSLPGEGSKRQKGRIIIEEYEDSDEYDENGFDNDYDSKENDVMDENLVLKEPKDEKLKVKVRANLKNNKDYYVNDYDETHEINSVEDSPGDSENEEDEEEEYDEDYNYEGDESEERDESYNDRDEDEENPDESIEKNKKEDDYYENYDYSEENERNANNNVNGDDDYVIEKKHNNHVIRYMNNNEILEEDKSNNVRVKVNKLNNGDVNKDLRFQAEKSKDYNYDIYDNYNDYQND